jgi:hypothetical protein
MTDTLNNMHLADRYATLKARADEIDALLKKAREEIIASGLEELRGDLAIVKVSLSETVTLDAKEARKVLTPDQVAACSRTCMRIIVTVKPRCGG